MGLKTESRKSKGARFLFRKRNLAPFGFGFWLAWILGFAVSFILAAAFWTVVMTWLFGRIAGPELTITWAVAVFGSWFILVIPFMRKKEQIWKRLNQDEEKSVDLWLAGMGILIGLLVASSLFWSFWFTGKMWAKAVFGSWLALLLPFLVLLYRRSDRIFKSALLRQSQQGPKFRNVFIERTKRLLPKGLSEKIRHVPPTLRQGHVLTLTLKDGSRIPDVFVISASEILGVYDRAAFDIDPAEIADVTVQDPAKLLPYEESQWLRLDGRA